MPNNQQHKTCLTCGNTIQRRLIICPHCGASTLKTTPESLIKCKSCNHDMAQYALKCPNCGKRTKRFSAVAVLMSLFVICLVAIFFMFSCGDVFTPPNTITNVNNAPKQTATTETQKVALYSDSFFEVEYMKLYDIPDNNYVKCAYIQLKVTNKSNQTITLSLDNVYVNDIFVQSGTGMPIELEPGKVSTTPFILFTGNTGLSVDDITKVEFNLKAYDDSYDTVHTTDKIVLNF